MLRHMSWHVTPHVMSCDATCHVMPQTAESDEGIVEDDGNGIIEHRLPEDQEVQHLVYANLGRGG
jgi:hypothetical protein